MKPAIWIMWAVFACDTLSASEFLSAPKPGALTGVSVPDARVVWEARLTVESRDLVQRRTDSFYFVPTPQASAEEVEINRSVSEHARYDPKAPGESWDYVAVIAPATDLVHVSLSSRARSASKQIERQAFFTVRPFIPTEGHVAGFYFLLEWIERKTAGHTGKRGGPTGSGR